MAGSQAGGLMHGVQRGARGNLAGGQARGHMHALQCGAHGPQSGRAGGPGGVGVGAGGAVGRGRLPIGNKPFNSIISPE
eukprot:1461471-Rhodomonas_salina.1